MLMLCCYFFFFLMIRRPPRSTRTDTLFPNTTLFRSVAAGRGEGGNRTDRHHPGFRIDILEQRRFVKPHRPCALHGLGAAGAGKLPGQPDKRSEEHTSELQSLMRISYAVFCLKKKKETIANQYTNTYEHTHCKEKTPRDIIH